MSYELILGDYPDPDRWTSDGRIDFAFTRLKEGTDYEQMHVETDGMLMVLPRSHPLSQEESIRAESLFGLPFFMLEKDGIREMDGLIPYDEGDFDIRIVTWDDYAVMSMAEAGRCVSILPSLILCRTPYDVVIRPLDPLATVS